MEEVVVSFLPPVLVSCIEFLLEAGREFAVVETAKAPVRAKVQLEGSKYEHEDVHPGERVLLWEVKDLESFFDRAQAGSDIAIQYRGTTETSNGRLAKVFNSAVER